MSNIKTVISNIELIDLTQVLALEKAYEEAVKEGKEQFIFEDQEVLTVYAKYLLQHLGIF